MLNDPSLRPWACFVRKGDPVAGQEEDKARPESYDHPVHIERILKALREFITLCLAQWDCQHALKAGNLPGVGEELEEAERLLGEAKEESDQLEVYDMKRTLKEKGHTIGLQSLREATLTLTLTLTLSLTLRLGFQEARELWGPPPRKG